VREPEVAPRVDWRLSAWLAGLLAACLALVFGVGWAVRTVPQQIVDPPDDPRGAILMVLADDAGQPLAAAVLGVDEQGATCVLAPRSLLLAAPEGGRLTSLASVAAASGHSAAVSVSKSLGVRVDGTWTLSTRGLVALVDSLNGIEVETDARVAANGEVVGEDSRGTRLNGDKAAAFAAAVPPRGSAEAAAASLPGPLDLQRMTRFAAVLAGLLTALPDDADQRGAVLTEILDSVEGGFRTTLPRAQVFDVMGDLHHRARNDQLTDHVLPTIPAADGATRGYDVDVTRLDAVLSGPLGAARLPVRVVVDQAADDAAAAAKTKLQAAKLDVTETRPQASPTPAAEAPRTTIVVPSRSAADRQHAREVAAALGVSAVIRVEKLQERVDVLVQLGKDFLAGLAATPTR
jgi:hypothetical protein